MSEPRDAASAEWTETTAIDHLVAEGFEYTYRQDWHRPSPMYRLTPRDESAVAYLREECGWGEVVR